MIKNEFVLSDSDLQGPAIARIFTDAEALLFDYFSILPRFRLNLMATFIIWFFTTFQFGRFLDEAHIDYGWNSDGATVANMVFRFISDFPHLQSRTYLPYIVSMLLMLLFLGSIVFSYFAYKKWQWTVPLSFAKLMIITMTTVFFFPITLATSRMVLGCLHVDPGSPHPFYPMNCWAGAHTALFVVSLVIYGIYLLACTLCLSCLFDSTIPLNPNTQLKHISSRTTNKVEVAMLFIKLILISMHSFGHDPSWRYPIAPVLVLCGIGAVAYNVLYVPYYTDVTQVAYTFQAAFLLWTGVVLFLQVYMTDASGLAMFYFLGLPLILGLSILLHNAQYEKIIAMQEREVVHSYYVDTYMKGLIRHFLGAYAILNPIYVEQDAEFLARRDELLFTIQHALELGAGKYPNNAEMHTLLSAYLAHVLENRVLAYSELSLSEKLYPGLPIRFQNSQLRAHLDEQTSRAQSQEIRAFLEFKQRKEIADNMILDATRNMILFWTELLTKQPRVDKLSVLGEKAHRALNLSIYHFKALLKINTQSIPVMRAFGRVLLDVLHDSKGAGELLDRAAAIEREMALKVHSLHDDANARLNTLLRITDESIDIFDERNAVVMINISARARGVIESVNSTWCKAFGYRSSSDLVGKKINMLQPDQIAEEHDTIIARYLEKKTSQIVGRTIMLLGKHQLGHLFPFEVYTRWSDEAQGSMVGVARVLPCEHDIYLTLDGQTRVVTNASLSLYSQLGVHKRDMYARKVEMGTFIPALQLVQTEEVDNSHQVDECWRKLLTSRGLETEGVHVVTNRKVNIHAWVSKLSLPESSFYMMKLTVTQIADADGVGFDTDSDDDLVGHQSYVNRFDDVELGLEPAMMSENGDESDVGRMFGPSQLSTRLASQSFSRTLSGEHGHDPALSNSNTADDETALMHGIAHALSSSDQGSQRGSQHASQGLLPGMDSSSARGGRFPASSMSMGATPRSGRGSVFAGASASPSMRSAMTNSKQIPSSRLNNAASASLSLLSPRSILSAGQVSLHMNNSARNSGRQSGSPPFSPKSPPLSAQRGAPETTTIEMTSLTRIEDDVDAEGQAADVEHEHDLKSKHKTVGNRRLKRALEIQQRIVSKRMFMMNLWTFSALCFLIVFALAIHFTTSETLSYSRDVTGVLNSSARRHQALGDAMTHLQSYYLLAEFPGTLDYFVRNNTFASDSYADVMDGMQQRITMSLDTLKTESTKTDYVNIDSAAWASLQDDANLETLVIRGGAPEAIFESLKSAVIIFSAQARDLSSSLDRQFYVLYTGMNALYPAMVRAAYVAHASLESKNTLIVNVIIALFVLSLVMVLMVMPLVVIPTILASENEKVEVVEMLCEIPRPVRKTVRRQLQSVYTFLRNDDDDDMVIVANDDNDDNDDKTTSGASVAATDADASEFSAPDTAPGKPMPPPRVSTAADRYQSRSSRANAVNSRVKESMKPDGRGGKGLRKAGDFAGDDSVVMAEDGQVNLDVISHAMRKVAEDDGSKLAVGNGGRVIQLTDETVFVRKSKWQQFVLFVRESPMMFNMSIKFLIFMFFMITYFTVIYTETVRITERIELYSYGLVYVGLRYPATQLGLLYLRTSVFFTHPLLQAKHAYDPFLLIPDWNVEVNSIFNGVNGIHTALLFGAPELPVTVNEKNKNRIMYKNLCTLDKSDLAPLLPVSYAPKFFETCNDVELGMLTQGVFTPLSSAIETLSVLSFASFNGIFSDAIEPAIVFPPAYDAIRAYAKTSYKSMEVLLIDYLAQVNAWLIESYYENVDDVTNNFENLRLILLILIIVAIFVMYFAIFKPIWTSLQFSLHQTRSMVLLVPVTLLKQMPKMQEFVTTTLSKE